jgi:hypothetical protein
MDVGIAAAMAGTRLQHVLRQRRLHDRRACLHPDAPASNAHSAPPRIITRARTVALHRNRCFDTTTQCRPHVPWGTPCSHPDCCALPCLHTPLRCIQPINTKRTCLGVRHGHAPAPEDDARPDLNINGVDGTRHNTDEHLWTASRAEQSVSAAQRSKVSCAVCSGW